MKKVSLIVTVFLLSHVLLSYSQTPMEDEPDGNCMTCQPCTGDYIICESNEVDAIFDKMNNCGPGSTSQFFILAGC